MSFCPCGSNQIYENCCGLYLEKKQLPQTPEQLMRSRYTAYTQAKIDYIKNTMTNKALIGFNELSALQWAQSVTWLGLEIIQANPTLSDVGYVEFEARFLERTQTKIIHEVSEFHKINDVWFYVDGTHKQTASKNNQSKIARNSLCPCGSGKKFKNCHAR